MGIIVRERAQEVALMEVQKREFVCGELEPELQLPRGWEKCLDLKVCVCVCILQLQSQFKESEVV